MITEQNILDAIRDARRGELQGHKYDQVHWCGTSCCVLGFARIRAGMPELDAGPQPGEIEDTPRARMLAALMYHARASVLDAMEAVQPDGSINYAWGTLDLSYLTALAAGATIKAGGNLYLGKLAELPAGVTLSAGGCINLCSVNTLAAGTALNAGAYLYLRELAELPAGVTLEAGDCIHLPSLTTLEPGAVLPANAYAPKLDLTGKEEAK